MEKKWDPHTCAACGAHFEVGYDEPAEGADGVLVDVACPRCGKPKSLCVPEGTLGSLVVEPSGDEEAEEGTGD